MSSTSLDQLILTTGDSSSVNCVDTSSPWPVQVAVSKRGGAERKFGPGAKQSGKGSKKVLRTSTAAGYANASSKEREALTLIDSLSLSWTKPSPGSVLIWDVTEGFRL